MCALVLGAPDLGQSVQAIPYILQLCHPCESEEVPETVKETWKMVDEYMLTEAEIALVKLLETMDKAAPLHAQPCTESDNVMRHAAKQSSDHTLAHTISVSAPRASTTEEAEAMSHSSRSSCSSSECDCTQQQPARSIVAESKQITFSTDITRTESVPDAKEADVAAGVHCNPSSEKPSDSAGEKGMAESGTQPTLPALSSQAAAELCGQASEAAHGQVTAVHSCFALLLQLCLCLQGLTAALTFSNACGTVHGSWSTVPQKALVYTPSLE